MTKWKQKRVIWAGLFIIFLISAAGCQNSKFGTSSISSKKDVKKSSAPVYYDFGDVLIPSEMKVEKKESFIYRTPGFTAGVLALRGRVEMNSLINFFDNNMKKDNWRQISSFRSPKTIMLFHKENRWCVISIREADFGNTRAEVWVAPTINQPDEGLLIQ